MEVRKKKKNIFMFVSVAQFVQFRIANSFTYGSFGRLWEY